MRPLIGVLVRYDVNEKGTPLEYVFETTRRAIIRMGGEPLLICPPQDIDYMTTKFEDFPSLTEEEKERSLFFLKQCDGLFLPGGDKTNPYDAFMLDAALKEDMPVFGVCLGMQIMANYRQEPFHLKDVEDLSCHKKEDKTSYAHEVLIKKDSKLFSILGTDRLSVNSFHKRCVDTCPHFRVVAKSSDGVVEAIERADKDFCIGVQWHPEHMVEFDENARKLWQAFISAAYEKQKSKKGVKI